MEHKLVIKNSTELETITLGIFLNNLKVKQFSLIRKDFESLKLNELREKLAFRDLKYTFRKTYKT